MARIAIIGPGAVGGTLAVLLAKHGGHHVTLCARRPLVELKLLTPDGAITVRPEVWTDPAQVAPVDWVFVTTKAYDVAGVAAWLARFGSACPVAILQNGVEHRERFAPYLRPGRIVPVMVDCPAERVSPQEIRQRGEAKMAVADDDLGRAFAALFASVAIKVAPVVDFKTAIWKKLCLNSAGAISALLLQPAGIMRDERLADLSRGLVRECIAVGRAEGAQLDDDLAESVLQNYRAAPPDAVNSLQADRAAGRPLEVDARNGAIVRLGRKHGIATPLNELMVALLSAVRVD